MAHGGLHRLDAHRARWLDASSSLPSVSVIRLTPPYASWSFGSARGGQQRAGAVAEVARFLHRRMKRRREDWNALRASPSNTRRGRWACLTPRHGHVLAICDARIGFSREGSTPQTGPRTSTQTPTVRGLDTAKGGADPATGSGIARQPDQAAEVVEKDTAAEEVVEKDTLPSGGGGTSGGARPPRKKDWTPEEHKAAKEFMKALLDDYDEYAAMSEDEIEDEYRRAGKLHKYDPEMEVAKKHPPPPGYYPVLEQDFKLIEDDED
ncbi:hypothetical protein HU200_055644 [Digitaria exilis]|uniref:Uncharacterized protein n=1 Tax=Digitaria exilis TaxID=1010633 RepID=A0A835AKD4_9POAL|nr:hypothetical protein HU200_055644 [Digitaria exilis]